MTDSLRSHPEADSQPQISEDAFKLFDAEDRKVTLKNIKNLTIIAMVLVPACSILDYFVYPKFFWEFFALRWTCVPVLFLTFLLAARPWGIRNFKVLTLYVTMVPAFFITVMISISRDPASPYYAGLTLCLVAVGLMFHWTHRQALTATFLVLMMYLAASVPLLSINDDPHTRGMFIGNCMFIMMTGVVVISGSIYHHRIRIREFLSRHQLDVSRKKLKETLAILKENELQLVQSEKLASLGQMSAGIIHEINNPLNYANSAIFLLKKKTKKIADESNRKRITEIVGDIQEGVTRVSTIVSELRDFSHPSMTTDETVNFAEVIRSAQRLMVSGFESNGISISVKCPDDAAVIGNKNQLVQVLLNLFQNATDAFSKDSSEPRKVDVKVTVLPDTVVISVRDNGTGIAKEHLVKLFDPFFTTKEVGSGMGLGLSICYRIIRDNEGTINVSSELGDYTEFQIRLRRAVQNRKNPQDQLLQAAN